jgi:hypothetical protein
VGPPQAAQLLKKETERKQKIKRKKAKLARQKKKKKSIKQQILEKNQKAKELLGMHRDSTLTLITLCIPQARSAAVTLADMKISAPDMFVHAAPEFSSYCNNPLITGNLIAYAFKNWTAIKSRQKQRTWVAEAKNGKWAAIAEQCPYQCQ